ncbi:MAG TPA: zinc-binding alcohol dehydrogenase family protein [Blastocatellia bacterium]|nr:zinc-binding alcohol dehydrogenase family protein [Blastocatellia bacterium]
MITTEAWVLHRGTKSGVQEQSATGGLRRELFEIPDISDGEVLAEPIFGCWEGNMSHAVQRNPIDICELRGEDKIIIGNSGVVRVLKTGRDVKTLQEGDLCILVGTAVRDRFGYMKKAPGYDAPNTYGNLAKLTKYPATDLALIPKNTKHSLQQWASFSLRYITAWANWETAYGCFRTMLSEEEYPSPFVWGWGGGCTLAELELAKAFGCRPAMIASHDDRLSLIERAGIEPIDRRGFKHLDFNEKKYRADPEFKQAYDNDEKSFLSTVREKTDGAGVSIFIDYIGSAVVRATLKALGSPGVITTAGWKSGMSVSTVRAIECINWHIHVHTHYARDTQIPRAIQYGEENGWMPEVESKIYAWDEISTLAKEYGEGKVSSYFPVYQVNSI